MSETKARSHINFQSLEGRVRDMDFFQNRYLNANRLILSVFGMWPYMDMRRKLAARFFFIIVFGTLAVLGVWKLTTMEITFWFIAYIFQYVVLGFMFISNLIYGWVCVRKLRRLLEHIKQDWSLLEPSDVRVIEPYMELGRKFTLVATVGCFCCSFIMLLVVSRPNNSLNSNVTVDEDLLQTLLPFDLMGINYEKYFIPIVVSAMVLGFLGAMTTLALGTLYLASVLHACGMFSIAGQRMESMFDDLKGDIYIYNKRLLLLVFRSIIFHTRAITFTNIINSFYGPLYFAKMLFIIILLTMDILQMTHAYNSLHKLDKLFWNLAHFCAILIMTAAFCYIGQMLLDHSNDIFLKIYLSQWYAAPLNIQKLIIIIMARSLRESGITITKSITASFEMFVTIVQMAVSYFMAINSLHE